MWLEWIDQFESLEKIYLPRQYAPIDPTKYDIELHIFVDASELTYAAVGYFRFINGSVTKLSLVMEKSRVMPIKSLSIPQGELMAATLGVRLANTIKQMHRIKIGNTFFWSDSRVIKAWIDSTTMRFKQFVALRVAEIWDSSTRKESRYIPSKLNVADDATKWTDPRICSDDRWFHGPEFLLLPQNQWHAQPDNLIVPEDSSYTCQTVRD